ncbi:unnamed protein product [Arabidopsis halleri]
MTQWENTYKDMSTLFNVNGKLGSHVTLEHMKSFEIWLLDESSKHRWSRQFHQFPDVGLDCNHAIMRFAGRLTEMKPYGYRLLFLTGLAM